MYCAICGNKADLWRNVDGYDFTDCRVCECIAIDGTTMNVVDEGAFPRNYDPSYWAMETEAAKERSYGGSLARVAETILYCRRPINKFVDIGSGPGFLLDALGKYLPASRLKFYGVEMFPPSQRSNHPNYIVGNLSQADHKFDAGVCIEVFEHLTPAMLRELAAAMAAKSNAQALYFINTSLSHHVRSDNTGYIDPLNRGHIVSWSIKAVAAIFEPYGFRAIPLAGKPWAFCLEYMSEDNDVPDARIWSPLAENVSILNDPEMGSALYVLGIDTARAYLQYA